MPSWTYALLWEMWRRHRLTIAAIAGLTMAGRLLYFAERGTGAADSSALVDLMRMLSFGLLFGIFNYADPDGTRGLGGFPRRLFTLPVSTMQLVVVPTLTAIASVELLHLLWLDRLSAQSTSPWFVAVLLAATTVCYQAAFWTLERLGPLRLIVMAAVVVGAFAMGLLPTFPPTPPPPWRSEVSLAALVAALAVMVFLISWRYIAQLRHGGGQSGHRLESLLASMPTAAPRTSRAFASPTAAHFWFEWRSSGLVLPVLVGGVLLVIIGPFSWLARDDPGRTMRLLFGTLLTPIVLAIPVGMAFARPTFWSDELSLPAFVAVRPLTDEDIVAIKVSVAAASVAASWLLVLSFLAMWLSLWANLNSVSLLALQWWAFHEQSIAAVYAIAALILIAGMLLTWRVLVSRLWTGLSGRTSLFVASVLSVFVLGVGGMVFNADRLPGWVLDEPARMAGVVWIMALAVAAKYWLAARTWRHVSTRYVTRYFLVWVAGTTCLLVLALQLWGVVRIYVPLDIYSFQAFLVLLALLAVPLGRVGLAPSALARNRHR